MARPLLNTINDMTGLFPIGPLPPKAVVAAFSNTATESLLQTKGFAMMHYSSCTSPDRHSFGAPVDPSTQAAYAGRVYYDARPLLSVPTQIKLEERLQVQGIYDVYSVVLNVTGHYTDVRPGQSDQVYIKQNDLLIPDFGMTIIAEQTFEYNPTGPQRLNFNAVGVKILFDREWVYDENTDFAVVNGMIQWLPTGTKPKFVDGQGAVLSCVYYTNPIFCVQAMPHALRVLPANSAGSGALPRAPTYFPQLVIAKNLTAANINPFDGNLLNGDQAPNLATYPRGGNTTGGSF